MSTKEEDKKATEMADTVSPATNGHIAERMSSCAACGKSGEKGQLKTCTACRSVKYCNVDCQRNHRKAHYKECNRIGKELKGRHEDDVDDDLFKLPPPKRECPICLLPLPNAYDYIHYLPCLYIYNIQNSAFTTKYGLCSLFIKRKV